MANKLVIQRMRGIRAQMMGAYRAGVPMSSSTKGGEREPFVDMLLRSCLPPVWRTGSGEITNRDGARTGQVDIVIEATYAPSLPLLGSDLRRLYLAESVVAAIEVKSNIVTQWNEALRTLTKARAVCGKGLLCYAVGFRGWKTPYSLRQRLDSAQAIHAILQLEPAMFAHRMSGSEAPRLRTGPAALASFVFWLCQQLPGMYCPTFPDATYLGSDEEL